MPLPACHTVSLLVWRFAGATGLQNSCAYVDFRATAELTHHVSLNPEPVSATRGPSLLLWPQNWVPGGCNQPGPAPLQRVRLCLDLSGARPGGAQRTCEGLQPSRAGLEGTSAQRFDCMYF